MGRPKKVLHIENRGRHYDKLIRKNMMAKGHILYSPLLNKFKIYVFNPCTDKDYVISSYFTDTGTKRTRFYYIGEL